MGGSAYLIHGTVAERLLAPRPLPRTWRDRVLLRTRTAAPRDSGAGAFRLVEVEAPELSALLRRFHAWLAPRLAGDPPGARAMRGYLSTVPGNTFLRGDAKAGGALDWYVQLSFSGCAGMAQTSADLAAHCVHLWLTQELAAMTAQVLLPLGFTPLPGSLPAEDPPPRFIATEHGHGLLLPELPPDETAGEDEDDPPGPGPTRLAFDDSLLETAGDALLKDLRRQEPAWIRALEKGCRCLLCAGAT